MYPEILKKYPTEAKRANRNPNKKNIVKNIASPSLNDIIQISLMFINKTITNIVIVISRENNKISLLVPKPIGNGPMKQTNPPSTFALVDKIAEAIIITIPKKINTNPIKNKMLVSINFNF